MNTNGLAKHYPALSPDERLSLMLAAAGRGDDVEHGRLADAAPRVTFDVPHTFGRALAFLADAGTHRMEQLDLAALFFKTSALADATEGELSARCYNVARLFGYLVNIHAEAWARFCEGERLDPAAYEAAMPGGATLEQAAREAAELGFSADEAREYAKTGVEPINRLKTVESVADELRAMYQMWVEKWE